MANYLKRLGMENVEIMPTVKVMPKEGGHPVVYADYIKKPRRAHCFDLWSL